MKVYNKNARTWDNYDLTTKHPNATIAKSADNLEIIDQRGQTCGLYALAAILRAKGVDVKATKRVVYPNNTEGPSLRKTAKDTNSVSGAKKISQIGDLFNTKDVLPLVNAIPPTPAITVTHHTIANEVDFINTLRAAIDKDKLIMVPFCVDDTGHPFANESIPAENGECAHWCLVFGYEKSSAPDAVIQFLTAHWGEVYSFDAQTFAKANMNIQDFPASFWCKEKKNEQNNIDYNKCACATCTRLASGVFEGDCIEADSAVSCVRIAAADLSATLAKQVVVIG